MTNSAFLPDKLNYGCKTQSLDVVELMVTNASPSRYLVLDFFLISKKKISRFLCQIKQKDLIQYF